MSDKLLRPAVFLDRDGVLIEDRPDYVGSWSQVVLIDGVANALAKLLEAGYALVVASNQSCIGRGFVTAKEVVAINAQLGAVLASQGALIEGWYVCPHAPEDGCDCRKPLPGLLLRAATELGLDLTRSWMVGDAVRDLVAADSAAVRGILVRTGKGETEKHGAAGRWPVEKNLSQAVSHILRRP